MSTGADSSTDRWIVVDGRRWRASDPSLPSALRSELVDELMSARRGVHAGQRVGAPSDVAAARSRVQDAKVALGERGRPWWEPRDDDAQLVRAAAAVRSLARHRAPKTTCPSDAARVIGGASWRSEMDLVRSVIVDLVAEGTVEVLQRGEVIDVTAGWRGPIRVRGVERS